MLFGLLPSICRGIVFNQLGDFSFADSVFVACFLFCLNPQVATATSSCSVGFLKAQPNLGCMLPRDVRTESLFVDQWVFRIKPLKVIHF